jgi:DNA repair photolyase
MMNVREIQAKTLLGTAARPDPWFGIKYTMNLYRGCTHRCIYCDSRSLCYGIEDFDGEVLVKANAIDLLRRELRGKRAKGYVSLGSMNDAYMPLERKLELTRRALEVIAEYCQQPCDTVPTGVTQSIPGTVGQCVPATVGQGVATMMFT